jgi:hypothetical protein
MPAIHVARCVTVMLVDGLHAAMMTADAIVAPGERGIDVGVCGDRTKRRHDDVDAKAVA